MDGSVYFTIMNMYDRNQIIYRLYKGIKSGTEFIGKKKPKG